MAALWSRPTWIQLICVTFSTARMRATDCPWYRSGARGLASLRTGETPPGACQQTNRALPLRPVNAPVDARQDVGALVPVEQVVDEEPDLVLGHDSRSHGAPPVRQREARHLLRLGIVAEPARRL